MIPYNSKDWRPAYWNQQLYLRRHLKLPALPYQIPLAMVIFGFPFPVAAADDLADQ
ncbi:hypothetical protein [Pontibacter sp. HJ8]